MKGRYAASVQSYKTTPPLSANFSVLVVDNDSTCLKIISRKLRLFNYNVLTATEASNALSILQEREDEIGLVLAEFAMPEMDAHEFLEQIGKISKLPVIIMSADDDKWGIVRCLGKGAVFYLQKPVTMHDVKNLWQHAFKNKSGPFRETEEAGFSTSPVNNKLYKEGQGSSLSVEVKQSSHESKKRKQNDMQQEDECNSYSSSRRKMPKMIWTKELQIKFLHAVKELGDNAYPRKILEHMNVSDLKMEHIVWQLKEYHLSMGHAGFTLISDDTGLSSGYFDALKLDSMGMALIDQEFLGDLPMLPSMDIYGSAEDFSNKLTVPLQEQPEAQQQQQQLFLPTPPLQLLPSSHSQPQDEGERNLHEVNKEQLEDEALFQMINPTDFDDLTLWVNGDF